MKKSKFCSPPQESSNCSSSGLENYSQDSPEKKLPEFMLIANRGSTHFNDSRTDVVRRINRVKSPESKGGRVAQRS